MHTLKHTWILRHIDTHTYTQAYSQNDNDTHMHTMHTNTDVLRYKGTDTHVHTICSHIQMQTQKHKGLGPVQGADLRDCRRVQAGDKCGLD